MKSYLLSYGYKKGDEFTRFKTSQVQRSLPDFLTVAEAAQLARISEEAIYKACNDGSLPHSRLGKIIRISREVLVRFLSGEARAGQSKAGAQ